MESSPIIGITIDIKGEYFSVRRDYSAAIIGAGGVPVLMPPGGNPVSYSEKIGGLLISGGKDLHPSYYDEEVMPRVKPVQRKRSDFEISLLKEVMKLHKPVLGICYGMQLINVALGGTLYQDIELQLSTGIDHREGYHKITLRENRFFGKGRVTVNSTHHQAIKELGGGLIGFAFSRDKLIEAFYMEDYPFLIGVQWHPERLTNDSLSMAIFDLFVRASRKRRNP